MSVEPAPSAARWWTLGVVVLGTFMLMVDVSIVAVALPQIHSALHAGFSQLQWVVDAYELTLAVLIVTAGSLGGRIGRKNVFQAGFVVFTLASLACGLSDTATQLSVSRGVQGVGAAVLFSVGPALLGHEFHGKERVLAFSTLGAVTGLAHAVGPLIGGSLTSAFSWRWIFLVNVPVGVFALAAAALKVRDSRDSGAHRVDLPGMATFTVALTAVVAALIRGGDDGWTSTKIVTLYAVGAVFLIAFVLIERSRGEAAMFDLRFLRNPTFVGIGLIAFFANGVGLPSVFIEANYLENLLHSSAWSAGLHFLPLTLSLFLFAATAESVAAKVPFRFLMAFACVAVGSGLLLTRLAGADSSWTALIPALIITGMGMGMFNPLRAGLAIGVTVPARPGAASSINSTFQQAGTALGIAAIGAIFQNRVTAAFTGSPTGHQLGAAAQPAAVGITAGSINAAAPAGPAQSAALSAARDSFVTGFHDAMTAGAVFAFALAVVALFLLRTKDLRSPVLSAIPPDAQDEEQDVALIGATV
jgi:EmrB/QacA subfamily drug resistance transporter